LDRHYFVPIYFQDPDGTILEIPTRGPGWTVDEDAAKLGTEFREPPPEMVVRNRDEAAIAAKTWPEPVPDISADIVLMAGMHHITAIGTNIERTHAFFGELLGMRRVKMTSNFDDPNSAHWYWGVDDGQPGTLITYFEWDAARGRRMQMGAGQTHHFALSVPDEDTQLEWRDKLVKAGLRVSPVMDRVYFKSLYTNDPDGHIVELATAGPGFVFDEEPADLGHSLKLPPWLEGNRSTIEGLLRPIAVPEWRAPETA
jgi:glyoxalase family protein